MTFAVWLALVGRLLWRPRIRSRPWPAIVWQEFYLYRQQWKGAQHAMARASACLVVLVGIAAHRQLAAGGDLSCGLSASPWYHALHLRCTLFWLLCQASEPPCGLCARRQSQPSRSWPPRACASECLCGFCARTQASQLVLFDACLRLLVGGVTHFE